MILKEFLAEQKKLMDGFELYWLHAHKTSPEHFPVKMKDSDWYEQFKSFSESVNKL